MYYCYSYQLKNFLKLNGISYIEQKRHKNGNRYWIYKKSEKLNQALTNWNLYKQVFSAKES